MKYENMKKYENKMKISLFTISMKSNKLTSKMTQRENEKDFPHIGIMKCDYKDELLMICAMSEGIVT